MAIEYAIDVTAGVLTLTLSGDVTTEDFRGYFERSGRDARFHPGLKRLAVLRDVRSFPQSQDVRAIAAKIRPRTSGGSVRVAVVTDSPLGRGMAAMILGNAGLIDRYEVFDDATSAMVWLIGSPRRVVSRGRDGETILLEQH